MAHGDSDFGYSAHLLFAPNEYRMTGTRLHGYSLLCTCFDRIIKALGCVQSISKKPEFFISLSLSYTASFFLKAVPHLSSFEVEHKTFQAARILDFSSLLKCTDFCKPRKKSVRTECSIRIFCSQTNNTFLCKKKKIFATTKAIEFKIFFFSWELSQSKKKKKQKNLISRVQPKSS